MPLIKSADDIKAIRRAGLLWNRVLEQAVAAVKPGVSLRDLNSIIESAIRAGGGTPSFLGHEGFPAASCLSLNAEVVHGIPDGRLLKDGDILGIDVGIWLDNRCVDAAITVPVGTVNEDAHRLLQLTMEALEIGVAAAKPGRKVGAISNAIQQFAEQHDLGIVRSLTGHGVGHKVHEDPEVPNYGKPTDGPLLRPGMVLAIEPMLALGSGSTYTDVDGWTVLTADGSLSAQFEYTVIITPRGAEVVTKHPER
jgi:methionyl aminopeptidase